jgi:Ca2+-binding RTX toxin-like protein
MRDLPAMKRRTRKPVAVGTRGDDSLEGGAGLDVYDYSAGDGNDTVRDTDGRGVLRYSFEGASRAIAGAAIKVSDAEWLSADGKFTYGRQGPDLVVTINGDAGGSLLLKDYRDGDFGIRLMGPLTDPSPQNFDIRGDLAPVDFDLDAAGLQTQTDSLGNVITDANSPAPDREDLLYDSAEADFIAAGGGDDVVLALRGGGDWVQGGAGRDRIQTGAGDDLVEGGSGEDIAQGGAGDDRLYGRDKVELAAAIVAGETAAGFAGRGDLLSGDAGDDLLVGSTFADLLLGGEGRDVIVAGGGDDDLFGDDGLQWALLDWSAMRSVAEADGVRTYTHAIGNAGAARNAIAGEADVLYGGSGADWVFASGGEDFVEGGSGADVLFGEAGADILIGGEGDDVLAGGEGADSYPIYGGMGRDTVRDGEAGEANVLTLVPGVSLASLRFARSGGDLQVGLRGLGDSLTIEGYYARTQTWTIRQAEGSGIALDEALLLPDPVGGHIERLWEETRLGQLARAGGAAHLAEWKHLGGGLFEGIQARAWLAHTEQATTETFTSVSTSQVLASNTTRQIEDTVLEFGTLGSSRLDWDLHRLETTRIESDGALIFGPGNALARIDTPGQGVVTLRTEPRRYNERHTVWSNPGAVVSYDTGTEVVLATVAYDYERHAWNQFATVTEVNEPLAATWSHPKDRVAGSQALVDLRRRENRYLNVAEIIGGPSANSIHVGSGRIGRNALSTQAHFRSPQSVFDCRNNALHGDNGARGQASPSCCGHTTKGHSHACTVARSR